MGLLRKHGADLCAGCGAVGGGMKRDLEAVPGRDDLDEYVTRMFAITPPVNPDEVPEPVSGANPVSQREE